MPSENCRQGWGIKAQMLVRWLAQKSKDTVLWGRDASIPGELCYLFRWSSRKRKVSRLASGSESSKFSMQLSFATGSERATDRDVTASADVQVHNVLG